MKIEEARQVYRTQIKVYHEKQKELSKQKNLKGIFVKEVLEMYRKGLCTEEEYQKAIEIGLEAM